MSSTNNKVWVGGAAMVALLMLVATYFLLIGPKRAEAADLRDQTAAVVQQNDKIEQDTALLKAQYATLGEQKARLAEITAQLPAQVDTSSLVRQISARALESGVTVSGVTPGTPAAYGSASASAATETASSATAGLYVIPLKIETTGSFAQTELFVKNVQADLTRFFAVKDVSLTRDTASTGVKATVDGEIFVYLPQGSASTTTGNAGATSVTTGTAATTATTTTASSSASVN